MEYGEGRKGSLLVDWFLIDKSKVASIGKVEATLFLRSWRLQVAKLLQYSYHRLQPLVVQLAAEMNAWLLNSGLEGRIRT